MGRRKDVRNHGAQTHVLQVFGQMDRIEIEKRLARIRYDALRYAVARKIWWGAFGDEDTPKNRWMSRYMYDFKARPIEPMELYEGLIKVGMKPNEALNSVNWHDDTTYNALAKKIRKEGK